MYSQPAVHRPSCRFASEQRQRVLRVGIILVGMYIHGYTQLIQPHMKVFGMWNEAPGNQQTHNSESTPPWTERNRQSPERREQAFRESIVDREVSVRP